jgi:hypothetical protein
MGEEFSSSSTSDYGFAISERGLMGVRGDHFSSERALAKRDVSLALLPMQVLSN